ncbi:hypothetical protein CEXT_121321 [Caerostris extrusa]|uniref:Uncharacterized protein n=1 Tax=Caerostris extrusa TaxID=172846 RepID=A0AAV4TQ71_CAEEX|nr:hypothetical protein CEXT_121321 [Caerostris extrusa]
MSTCLSVGPRSLHLHCSSALRANVLGDRGLRHEQRSRIQRASQPYTVLLRPSLHDERGDALQVQNRRADRDSNHSLQLLPHRNRGPGDPGWLTPLPVRARGSHGGECSPTNLGRPQMSTTTSSL